MNFSRLFNVSSYRDNRLFLGTGPPDIPGGKRRNFFSPTHTPNKLFADQGLVAPELQVITPETIVSDASLYAYISTREQLDYWHENDTSESTQEHLNRALTHDLSPLVNRLEASGLNAVIDFLDEYMAQGRLSAQAKTELFRHFGPQLQRLRSATYYNSESHRRAHSSLLVRLICRFRSLLNIQCVVSFAYETRQILGRPCFIGIPASNMFLARGLGY